MIKPLELHINYADNKIVITAAIETENGHFTAKRGNASCLSEYMISRTINEGKTLPEAEARAMFLNLSGRLYTDQAAS